MKFAWSVVVVCGMVATAGVAGAQSLADVAKQEKERRKAVAEPARVYTEADVQTMAPLTTAAARPEPAAAGASPGGTSGAVVAGDEAAQGAKAPGQEGAPPTDEAGWQARLQQAREELARSRRLLSAMEQQLLALGLQNGSAQAAGRPVPGAAKQEEAFREVERLRAEVDKNTAALAQVDADARTAGVPPGWVR